MKISISGEEYPLFEAIGQAELGDLHALLKQSGVTISSIKAMFGHVLEHFRSGGKSLELFEDLDYIDNVTGVVFLALRRAGHDITLADARRVPAFDVFLVFEDDDADPKGEAEPRETSTT